MILQELVKHYEILARQEKVFRPGWCMAKVSYALDINKQGEVLGVITLKTEEPRGKKMAWVSSVIKAPEMVSRSSGVSANFLCDNSKYILGIDRDGTEKRSLECFEAAKMKHLSILESVNSDSAEAVKNFFLSWNPKKAKNIPCVSERWEDLTDGGNLIFLVEHSYAQEDETICQAWNEFVQTNQEGEQGICLVTGDRTRVARIHSAIKGVQGAQSSGAALVSFNKPAFESYGKEQSYNAPVGKYAAYAYTTALNYLLSRRDYVFRLGDTTIVFWSENGEDTYPSTFMEFMEPQEDNQQKIKSAFENLQTGCSIDIDGTGLNPEEKFYILGLNPNAARLSVSFFYEDSFGNILYNIGKHYRRMEIIRPSWEDREFFGIWRMVMETVNQKSRDKKPQPVMASSVFKAILSGGKYPQSLYSNVLIRIRAEQGAVTRGKAAIIKACLIRNYGRDRWIEEGLYVALNENCKDMAYILGREFAVLEALQEEANPGINATIKDRYFNSACATPASVFPILFKLKESHIKKIQNEKKGIKIYYEKVLTGLQGLIEVGDDGRSILPKRLSLEEQGMFILGYYHQVQKRFEKKEDK